MALGHQFTVARSRPVLHMIAVGVLFGASSAASAAVDSGSLRAFAAKDLRLASVGYRLSRANAGRCAQPQRVTGLVLHDLQQYGRGDRATVSQTFGLGRGIGILGVVAGSPASRAGLRPNDEILSINGVDLINRTPQAAESYGRVASTLSLLERPGGRRIALVIRRAGSAMSASVEPELGCGGRFYLSPSRSLNAWSDGRYVEVSESMLDFAANDDELAFVVAHEMAHNMLNHQETLASSPSGLLTGLGIGSRKVKASEIEADDYAVELMVNARYDPERSIPFLNRAGRVRWWDLAVDHPGIGRRVRTVMAALDRVHAHQGVTFAAADPKPRATASWPTALRREVEAANVGSSDISLRPLLSPFVLQRTNLQAPKQKTGVTFTWNATRIDSPLDPQR